MKSITHTQKYKHTRFKRRIYFICFLSVLATIVDIIILFITVLRKSVAVMGRKFYGILTFLLFGPLRNVNMMYVFINYNTKILHSLENSYSVFYAYNSSAFVVDSTFRKQEYHHLFSKAALKIRVVTRQF